MPNPPDLPQSSKLTRSRARIVFALILGLFLGVAAVGSIGWLLLSRSSGRTLLSHMWSAVTCRTLTIDVSQPTVVDRIQRLQALENAIYPIDKIVSGAEKNPGMLNFIPADC